MLIHCIGNSHVNTFSFSPQLNYTSSLNKNFSLNHLGPVIAYNFVEHHLPKVFENYLPKVDKNNDYILFCVGEVDCRLHLPLKADEKGVSDEEITIECADRFKRVYKMLEGYKFIVASTHPTTILPHNMSNMEAPIYGSCERRNNICKIWNSSFRHLAKEINVPYLDIYKHLVDSNNITKSEYFLDYCHLNSRKIRGILRLEFKKIGFSI